MINHLNSTTIPKLLTYTIPVVYVFCLGGIICYMFNRSAFNSFDISRLVILFSVYSLPFYVFSLASTGIMVRDRWHYTIVNKVFHDDDRPMGHACFLRRYDAYVRRVNVVMSLMIILYTLAISFVCWTFSLKLHTFVSISIVWFAFQLVFFTFAKGQSMKKEKLAIQAISEEDKSRLNIIEDFKFEDSEEVLQSLGKRAARREGK